MSESQPPWERYAAWRDARDYLLSVLGLAREIRDRVIDDLSHPHDDPLSWGVTFFVRWRGTLAGLASSDPRLSVVNFQRGVFALLGVPFRLYRAGLDELPPRRVLEVSREEFVMRQMWLFRGEAANTASPQVEPTPNSADARLRIRAVPDVDERIAEFLLEELDPDGDVTWSWGIRAEEVPRVFQLPADGMKEPIEQPTPPVSLRARDAKDDAEEDE